MKDKVQILVIGDIIVDRYVTGTSTKMSFEAPVPILDYKNEELRLGGAGNVALNLKYLDSSCKVSLMGVVGDDVLKEFEYSEVNSVLDLRIGKCKLSVAHKKDFKKKEENNGYLMVATKYKNTVTNYYANKGVRAECIKLNGAIELAPKLGICSTIVDLVSSGKTLKENNLKEDEVLLKITSKLIVNKIAFKLNNDKVSLIISRFKKALSG